MRRLLKTPPEKGKEMPVIFCRFLTRLPLECGTAVSVRFMINMETTLLDNPITMEAHEAYRSITIQHFLDFKMSQL